MLSRLYAKWMFAWETALTTRDTNRIVRPLEWGFEWLPPLDSPDQYPDDQARMTALSAQLAERSDEFFGYVTPTDFRLESRHPQLFPTNVRPETLAQDADLKRKAVSGELEKAQFLRFTSGVRTPHPENDQVNARWFPAPPSKDGSKRRKALIVRLSSSATAISFLPL